MTIRTGLLSLMMPLLLGDAAPQQPPAAPVPPAKPTPPKPPTDTPELPPGGAALLKITIESSRLVVAMDTAAGLSAQVENVGKQPVRLLENEAVFMTVPEMRLYGESAVYGCATFPTQGNRSEAPKDVSNETDTRRANRPADGYEVVLQPGDTYRIFWDMSRNGCTGQPFEKGRIWERPLAWFESKWQRIAFTPGTYKVFLNVIVHPESTGAAYRTVSEGREVQVSASQQMILLASALGGLLAYLIKLYYGVETLGSARTQNTRFAKLLASTEWLSAALFASVMVVLASRLSDTFPIKISADDFWGAVTLGFAFQWIGVKLLEKLPGMAARTPPPPPAPPANP